MASDPITYTYEEFYSRGDRGIIRSEADAHIASVMNGKNGRMVSGEWKEYEMVCDRKYGAYHSESANEYFALRGFADTFYDAYDIVERYAAVPQPTEGGAIFILNIDGQLGSGSTIIPAFAYNYLDGSCTIEGQSYTEEELKEAYAYRIESAQFPWNVGDGEMIRDYDYMFLSVNEEETPYYELNSDTWFSTPEEIWIDYRTYLSPNEPEITRVYYKGSGTYLSQGELGYKILGGGTMGICVASRMDMYYGDDEEGFDADWTTEAPDEVIMNAYFGSAPITIPEGFYVIDVKCNRAFTFTSNKADRASNVWDSFHIGEYGEFGLDNGLSQGLIKFGGNTPIVTIFAITAVTSNTVYSGYRLSWRSGDGATTPHGSSMTSAYFDYKNAEVSSYSSFLFFSRLNWDSATNLSKVKESPYPWMFYMDHGTTHPLYNWPKVYPFSLPRSLWSVSNGTLTWNGDTNSKTDIAYYYNTRNVRIMLSKTNMSEVREAFPRSAANQTLTANLANGASSSMYEYTKSTVLTAREGTQYKVIQLVGASERFLSTDGITLSVAVGGAMKITNNSGATVAWLKVRYREILS